MEKYPKRVIVRLTPQQDNQLHLLAEADGLTVSKALRKLIEKAYHDRDFSKDEEKTDETPL